MKKLLLVCCIVLGVSTLSKAQGGGGRPQMAPADQAAQLKTTLALTDAQTAKITTILTAQAASRDSLQKAGGDMRTGFAPIRTATTAKIKAVLTPDQATAYDKQMAAMRGGGRGGAGGGGGTPPPPQR